VFNASVELTITFVCYSPVLKWQHTSNRAHPQSTSSKFGLVSKLLFSTEKLYSVWEQNSVPEQNTSTRSHHSSFHLVDGVEVELLFTAVDALNDVVCLRVIVQHHQACQRSMKMLAQAVSHAWQRNSGGTSTIYFSPTIYCFRWHAYVTRKHMVMWINVIIMMTMSKKFLTNDLKHAQIAYWIGLCSVLRPRQHSTGYMGDGFYRSKDPINSIRVLKEQIVHRQIKHTINRQEHKTQQVP